MTEKVKKTKRIPKLSDVDTSKLIDGANDYWDYIYSGENDNADMFHFVSQNSAFVCMIIQHNHLLEKRIELLEKRVLDLERH